MGSSILQRTGESAPETAKGHGTEALGPSDTSDSGSDIVGNRGLGKDIDTGLDSGPYDDPDRGGRSGGHAGADIGDTNLDSDSDSVGTGERATAGRDAPIEDGADIAPDHIEDANGQFIEDLDEEQRNNLH